MRRLRATRLTAATLAMVMLVWVSMTVPVAFANGVTFAVLEKALYSGSPGPEAHFGSAVAVSGNTVVVGEPERAVTTPAAKLTVGVVSIYVKSGSDWVLQKELWAPTVSNNDKYGSAVAIDGDTLIVGAPDYNGGAGAKGGAFVYKRYGTSWTDPWELTGVGINAGEKFGSAVAIDGTTVAVGAPLDGRGTVWPYVWTGGDWSPQPALTDPAGLPGDNLGSSVAVDGDTILAGAPGDAWLGHADVGSVSWFTRSGAGWTHRQNIYDPDPETESGFGGPIAVSDGRFIVGAMSESIGGTSSAGAAYVFYNDGADWHFEERLTAPVPTYADLYGSSVALDGRTALVGAFFADGYKGKAYFYTNVLGTWTMREELGGSAYSPVANHFGTSAALSDGTAVIGAQMSGAPGVPGSIGAGAAFVYDTRGTLSGVVRDAVTGLPVAGIEMSAYVPDQFGDPELVALMNTDAFGRYSFSLDSGQYWLGWMDGTKSYYPGFYNEVAVSADATFVSVQATQTTTVDLSIHPKPHLTLTKTTMPSAVRRFHRFTVRGFLKPRHRPGSYPVTIQCYRWERLLNGRYDWVLRKTVRARAYDYKPRRGAKYTRYSATFSLPHKGSWKIRTFHAADGTYAPTFSSFRRITVR